MAKKTSKVEGFRKTPGGRLGKATPANIQRLGELLRMITPGPWDYQNEGQDKMRGIQTGNCFETGVDRTLALVGHANEPNDANAEFIALARNVMADLIEQARTLSDAKPIADELLRHLYDWRINEWPESEKKAADASHRLAVLLGLADPSSEVTDPQEATR